MSDLRLALRRRPLFTAVAVVTLALGIGATTTLFTIVNAVLLRPLPYPEANRIVSLSESRNGQDDREATVTDYLRWARGARAFEALAAYGGASAVFTGRGAPVRLEGAGVSADFFRVFGVTAARGRVFRADDDVHGMPDVVVLSDRVWRAQMGADPAAIGREVLLDGVPQTVIGIMPPGFAAPRSAQYWVPGHIDELAASSITFYTQVVGRLKPGVDPSRARVELSTLNREAAASTPSAPGAAPREAVVMTLHDRMFGSTRPALLSLFGAVAFLLLIACANVANLLLARAVSRRREFAVLVALGATRWRLARRLLWESVIVGLAGGGVGLLIPFWSVAYFVRISPASVAQVGNIHVDGRVLAFCAGVSLLTGLLFGFVPAITATRGDTSGAIKDGSTRATWSAGQHRVRRALVVAELATALVVLTGAGLLTRSFVRAVTTDVGFHADHTLAVSVWLQPNRYRSDRAALAFFDRTADEIRALPGVRNVGYSDAPLVFGYAMSIRLPLPGTGKDSPAIGVARTSAGFMQAAGLELVDGRFLTREDRTANTGAMVVSEAAARLLFPGQSAVGGQVRAGVLGPDPLTVVGVVRDVREPGVTAERLPQFYLAEGAGPTRPNFLAVRYDGADAPLIAALRRLLGPADPVDLRYSVATMRSALDQSVAPRRFNSVVIDVFAALALVLAAVGLYGVMAGQVAARTQELGIRMALGADRWRILSDILRDGMTMAALGTAVGIALSLAMSRVLAGMLYGVTTRDITTFVAGPTVMLAVALAACYLPARRATTVDPIVALRYE